MSLDFIRKRDLHIHIPKAPFPRTDHRRESRWRNGDGLGIMRVRYAERGDDRRDYVAWSHLARSAASREKLLAAHRFGIDTIIMPKDSEKDLPDVPEEVRSVMNINLVETIDEAIALALEEQAADVAVEHATEARPSGRLSRRRVCKHRPRQ
jgi:ATP-dependent Lon protease